MSRFSGKCDLYDCIGGRGGWYDRDGNPVEFGQAGVGAFYSDEMKDFLAFKEATGGKIYQHHKVKVDQYNFDFVQSHCKSLERKEGPNGKPIYSYFGTEYDSLKALNKHGVYIEVPVEFETLLDIIPYYPYIVSVMVASEGKLYVVVSGESFVESEFKENLNYGRISGAYYKKELQRHYLDVCEKYFLKDYDERIRTVGVKDLQPTADGRRYEVKLPYKVDQTHGASFVWEGAERKPYWSSPRVSDDGMRLIFSKEDVEHYLVDDIKAGVLSVRCVKALPDDLVYVE